MKNQRINIFSFFSILLLLVSLLINPISAQGQVRRNTKKIDEKRSIPFSVNLDEEAGKRGEVVTLAVGTVTTIKCPEPPLKYLIGNNKETLDVVESSPGLNLMYIHPNRGNVFTDITIEMKSGKIVFYVRTIDVPGGAKAGDYTAEIVLSLKNADKAADSKNEAIKFDRYRSGVNSEIDRLKNKLADLQIDTKERIRSAREDAELETLRALESSVPSTNARNYSEMIGKQIRVGQIGKSIKTSNGWIVLFSIENKGKVEVKLDDIQIKSNKIILRTTGPRRLPARGNVPVALQLQIVNETDTQNIIPANLTFTINGTGTEVKFEL